MGYRLLEGRSPKSLIARPAPPFDREVVDARFGEMMRDRFRLGGLPPRLPAQDFSDPAMQGLAAALQKAFVGRVLDQRVFEAIVRLRADALDEENVSLGKAIQRRRGSSPIEARLISLG